MQKEKPKPKTRPRIQAQPVKAPSFRHVSTREEAFSVPRVARLKPLVQPPSRLPRVTIRGSKPSRQPPVAISCTVHERATRQHRTKPQSHFPTRPTGLLHLPDVLRRCPPLAPLHLPVASDDDTCPWRRKRSK